MSFVLAARERGELVSLKDRALNFYFGRRVARCHSFRRIFLRFPRPVHSLSPPPYRASPSYSRRRGRLVRYTRGNCRPAIFSTCRRLSRLSLILVIHRAHDPRNEPDARFLRLCPENLGATSACSGTCIRRAMGTSVSRVVSRGDGMSRGLYEH